MTIPVGFSSAAAGQATTGTTTAQGAAGAKGGEGGLPSLFAMLMALIGGKPADALAEGEAALTGLLETGQPSTSPLLLEAAEPESGEAAGMLADLGSLLAELTSALQSGEPLPEELKQQLGETLDAVAAALGLPAAPQPTSPPAIAAEAALPGADADPALPPVPQDAPDATNAPDRPERPAEAAPPKAEPHLLKLADEFARRLEGQSPELAQKLKQVLTGLAQADLPAEQLQRLGSEAAARLTGLAMAPQAERPVAASPQFAAPTLEAPEGLAAPDLAEDTKPERPEVRAHDRPTPAPERNREIRIEATDGRPGAASPASPAADPAAASQPLTAATAPATAAGARVVHAAYQAPVQQLNLPAIAFDIVRHVEGGNSRFQIRLDPPELGRIDLRMDVDQSGSVHARLTVERSETLDLLQRDQRALQQALQQAGLDGSKTSLEFSLRQNPFGGDTGQGQGQGSPFGGGNPLAPVTPDADTPDLTSMTHHRGTARADGVNLFV